MVVSLVVTCVFVTEIDILGGRIQEGSRLWESQTIRMPHQNQMIRLNALP
jgi:hypothetical protein